MTVRKMVTSYQHEIRTSDLAPQRCADCDEPATRTFDEGVDFAYWTGHPRYTPVCDECGTTRDNREPPEVTFDDALGAVCDRQMREEAAWRLKR